MYFEERVTHFLPKRPCTRRLEQYIGCSLYYGMFSKLATICGLL